MASSSSRCAVPSTAPANIGTVAAAMVATSSESALTAPRAAGRRVAEDVAHALREIAGGGGGGDRDAGAAMPADREDSGGVFTAIVTASSTASSQARSRSSSICRPIHHTAGWNQNSVSTSR